MAHCFRPVKIFGSALTGRSNILSVEALGVKGKMKGRISGLLAESG